MTAVGTVDLRAGLADPRELDPVVAHLAAGGLAVHPTETVYGFGGLATPEAVAALRRLKGRADERPFLVLLPAADAAPTLVWTDARTLRSRPVQVAKALKNMA